MSAAISATLDALVGARSISGRAQSCRATEDTNAGCRTRESRWLRPH